MIPHSIVIHADYLKPRSYAGPNVTAKVLAIFRDSHGDLWCAFDLPGHNTWVDVLNLRSQWFIEFTEATDDGQTQEPPQANR